MNGIDTNVLIRHLVQDDPVQGPQATAWLDANCSRSRPGWIDRMVLAELIWSLDRSYRFGRTEIAATIEQLLRAGDLVLDAADEVLRALALYRVGGVDFADALIGLVNAGNGCTTTVAFDRKAGRMDGFTLL